MMSREAFVEESKSFIHQKYEILNRILGTLGWELEDLNKLVNSDVRMVHCPYNVQHRMPETSLQDHINKCEKKNRTYPFEPGLVTPSEYQSIISVGATQKLDCDESSAFTETMADKPQSENNANSGNSSTKGSKQLVELLAAERDAKRRRAAHRGKRVHTKNKTYVDVLREVINSQMEALFGKENGVEQQRHEDTEHQESTILTPKSPYLGIGITDYDGNPYERWKHIEEEEKELIEIQAKQKLGLFNSKDLYESKSKKDRSKRKSRSRSRDYKKRSKSILVQEMKKKRSRRSSSKNRSKEKSKYSSKRGKSASRSPIKSGKSKYKSKRDSTRNNSCSDVTASDSSMDDRHHKKNKHEKRHEIDKRNKKTRKRSTSRSR